MQWKTPLRRGNIQGSASLPAASGLLVISGGSALQQDLQMAVIAPIPAGVSLTPSRLTIAGAPRVNWKQNLRLAASGCAGGSATYQVQQSGAVISSGELTENPAGQYSATLAALYPLSGYVQVSLAFNCSALRSTLSPEVSYFDVYVDPTGTVRSASGRPIEGAMVTLFSYDPVSMTLSPVPADSPLFSPANQVNPALTDSAGHFGWDMAAGTYLIRAEKVGCNSANDPGWDFVQTGILETPAELVDLDLRLACPDSTTFLYLPVISR